MDALRERAGGPIRALFGLPDSILRPLAGPPITIDGATLAPELQLYLRLEALAGGAAQSELSPSEARARTARDARMVAGRPLACEVRELEIPGRAGQIAARLYSAPGAASPSPLVVYLHGGGWVVGDLDTHDQPCRFLARESGARLLAVDYRLAPEHPFPAAVEDAVAALRFAFEQAPELGADPARIAVAGDSAGGNLATVACALAVAGEAPVPRFQALIYPATDALRATASYARFATGFGLEADSMDWYDEHYFQGSEEAKHDPRASPLRAKDLSGLPPAYVVTAGFDVLRDEGEAYARSLVEASVPTAIRRQADLIHSFANGITMSRRSREAMLEVAAAIRVGLA